MSPTQVKVRILRAARALAAQGIPHHDPRWGRLFDEVILAGRAGKLSDWRGFHLALERRSGMPPACQCQAVVCEHY